VQQASAQRATISTWEAAALVALTFAALTTVGVRLAAYGVAGTVAGELACVIVPTILFVAARRVPLGELGLARFGPLATVGGALFGGGAFYLVAVGLHAWIERVWPTPPELREAMHRMVIPAAGARPLVVDLVALALVPAAGEELMFRGVVFGAVRPRFGATAAVVVAAIAFGLYHGSVYRFAPAAFAGLLLGVARAASASLWPALAFHFANNAGVIIALHLGYETPPAGVLPLTLALACTGAGATMLRSRA